MDWERRCIRTCGAVLVCAVVLRLVFGGNAAAAGELLKDPDAASFLVYLQTGRVVRTIPQPVFIPTQPASTTEPELASPPLTFTSEDLELVQVKYTTDYRPDLEALLTEPLELEGGEPAVLILHTHTTESYTGDYEPSGEFRTLDPECNMLRIGDEVAAVLEESGISVIHDREFHDYPSYNSAYNHAEQAIQTYLEEYPSIRLVLDLHRDAADTAYGQMVTECSVGGQTAAQLMVVVGTGSGGLSHPNWQENLSLGLKLHVTLEKQNPGICRDLSLTHSRYNQHLSAGALLVEVGAAGNTLNEALIAANALGEAIAALFQGT